MAADPEQPSDSTWILGSFTKPEGEDLSVSFLREVSDEERAALQEAAQFLRSVHSGAGYQSFVLAARDVEDRAGRLQETRSPVEHAALQRAIEIACKLAHDCADKIIESIGGYELVEGTARTALTGEIREYRSEAAALDLCDSIVSGTPVAVVEQPHEQGFAVRAGSRVLDPLRLMAGTAAELQTMLALQLRGLAPAISEASLTLRNGTAEVLDGAPCLFRRAAGEQGKPGQMNVQPDDLALGIIAPLQRLVGRAEQLLAAPQPATEPVEEDSPQPAGKLPAGTDSTEEPPPSSEQEESGQEVVPPGVLSGWRPDREDHR